MNYTMASNISMSDVWYLINTDDHVIIDIKDEEIYLPNSGFLNFLLYYCMFFIRPFNRRI